MQSVFLAIFQVVTTKALLPCHQNQIILKLEKNSKCFPITNHDL